MGLDALPNGTTFTTGLKYLYQLSQEEKLTAVHGFLQGQDNDLRECWRRVDSLEGRIPGEIETKLGARADYIVRLDNVSTLSSLSRSV